jgi:hypothetical protein
VPATPAIDRRRYGAACASDAAKHAATWPLGAREQAEEIAIGLGVQIDREAVALVAAGLQPDHGALAVDVGSRRKTCLGRRTAHCLAEPQMRDLQASNLDVEAGKNRSLLGAAELRQAIEGDEVGRQIIDIEPVGQPTERMPIEPDGRCREKLAPQIIEADVA